VDTICNFRRVGPAAGRGPRIDRSCTRDSPPVSPSVMPEALSNSGRGCDMRTSAGSRCRRLTAMMEYWHPTGRFWLAGNSGHQRPDMPYGTPSCAATRSTARPVLPPAAPPRSPPPRTACAAASNRAAAPATPRTPGTAPAAAGPARSPRPARPDPAPPRTCGCRKPVPPGDALGIAVGSVKRLGVGRAGLGSAGGGMIFGLWA